MVVSFLALSLGTITFENPGIRLELFLKEMSKKTGVGFHCPVYLNNEVLAASFKDQSIDVLKSQLARVIHGTWEQKEDGWWLIQSSDQKKEEKKWMWETRNKALQVQIDGLKSVAPINEWTLADATQSKIDLESITKYSGETRKTKAQLGAVWLQTPGARLFAGIATKLTVDMFKEDPLKYDSNRYSVRGLPGHIDLPIEIRDSFRRFDAERDLYAQSKYFRPSEQKTVHLEIRIRHFGNWDVLEFKALDKDWKTISVDMPSVYLSSFGDRSTEKPEVFQLSEETKQVLSLQDEIQATSEPNPNHWNATSSKLFEDAVSVMLTATKRDPLGIIQGRCWIDFARYINKPLIVNLSENDRFFLPKVVPALDQDGKASGMIRLDTDGWVLGRPVNPLHNRSWRLDRQDIARFANLTKTGLTPNLYPFVKKNALAKQISLFSSGIPNSQFMLNSWRTGYDLTDILGTMTETQLNQCLKGDMISTSKLPSKGYELLAIYANEGVLNELTPYEAKSFDSLCPLYYLPNGIENMEIGASIKTEPDFRFENSDETHRKNEDVTSMARIIRSAKSDSPIYDSKFKMGLKRTLTATVFLGHKSKSHQTSIPIEDTNLPTFTWKTLPDQIRQMVLDAMNP